MFYIDENSARDLYSYAQLAIRLLQAHETPTQVIEDLLLESEHKDLKNHFFLRAAWQKDNYLGSKIITIFPQNRDPDGPPSIQALYTLFDGITGTPLCCIDGTVLTALKTATDSALAADLLARNNIKTMLMIGAGGMAPHLIEAHCEIRPSLENILIWNRTSSRCKKVIEILADKGIEVKQVDDLDDALSQADLISSATTTPIPLVKGKKIKPGCHIDLVGSFTEDLREADNDAIRRSSIFVDSRKMTVDVVGEIILPINQGAMTATDIKADFYDAVVSNCFARSDENEITLFKNGGGGHLDLMMAHILYKKYNRQMHAGD